MYTYIYIYIYIYLCTYIQLYILLYNIYTYIYIHIYSNTYLYLYIKRTSIDAPIDRFINLRMYRTAFCSSGLRILVSQASASVYVCYVRSNVHTFILDRYISLYIHMHMYLHHICIHAIYTCIYIQKSY